MSKVSTILTDAGAERHTVEMPDVLRAFLSWNAGTPLLACTPLVATDDLLFPNALRLFGWSHAWSNIRKVLASVCPSWDHRLNHIRCLASFWRNRTWRKWVQEALARTNVDPRVFRSFTATVAKWRYGTIPHSMERCCRSVTSARIIAGSRCSQTPKTMRR